MTPRQPAFPQAAPPGLDTSTSVQDTASCLDPSTWPATGIIYLDCHGNDGPKALTGGPRPSAAALPLYQLAHLPDTAWLKLRALLIPMHVDQRFLVTQQTRLESWLLSGGTMVVNGHIGHPFLRWLRPFVAQPVSGLTGLQVHRGPTHPVFDGVRPEDLTYRRGVAGFYARGGNPVPPGGMVLNTIGPNHMPVDWLLNLPGNGRLLVHSGNDLWMYAHGNDSAARIVPQLLDWIASGEQP